MEGIDEFVFNKELPVFKKSVLLQKTEDEQVKSLVERKQAFSAGGIWMTLGFKLMGSNATIRAQCGQIEQEKAATIKSVEKKEEDLRVKVEKADASFQLYKSGAKMPLEAWKDIVLFLVPLYDKDTAQSKLGTIKKATEKLNPFQGNYGSAWEELMEVQLRKFQSKQPAKPNADNNCLATF